MLNNALIIIINEPNNERFIIFFCEFLIIKTILLEHYRVNYKFIYESKVSQMLYLWLVSY
nr:MAG TPA: hypothetical protein [Caudoviricetes sp.]